MEITQIRWLNARLIHVFSGNKPYSHLAETLDKNVGLVTRWFYKKGFRKIIGDQIARHIEVVLAPHILDNTESVDINGWMDTTHYTLWHQYLGEQIEGEDDEPTATYSAVHNAILYVWDRTKKLDAKVTGEGFAKTVVRFLPLWSDDKEAKEKAVDDLLLETADKMISNLKKKTKPKPAPVKK